MSFLNIGGVNQPTPSGFSVGIQDIVKAARNANGTMIKELIATKRKLDLSYKFMTQAEITLLLNAIKGNFFTVVYFDPQLNANNSATFYSGDRNCGFYDFNGGFPRYQDVKFTLIER